MPQSQKNVDKLLVLLNNFLASGQNSDPHGGWSPVSNDEMSELQNIIYALIRLKWAEDNDGDLPIEFKLINRNVSHRLNYIPMPYTHHDDITIQEVNEALQIASINLSVAFNEMERTNNLVSWHLRSLDDKKSKAIDTITRRNLFKTTHTQ